MATTINVSFFISIIVLERVGEPEKASPPQKVDNAPQLRAVELFG